MRRLQTALLFAIACLCTMAGCRETSAPAGWDLRVPDAGDVAETETGCAPEMETCNGTDDDCDGEIDEGCDGCRWTDWCNADAPSAKGDYDNEKNCRKLEGVTCHDDETRAGVECEGVRGSYEDDENVRCTPGNGSICVNSDQSGTSSDHCGNRRVRFQCCPE